MINNQTDQLISLLNNHADVTDKLKDLTSDIRNAIREGSVKNLDALVKLQAAVLMRYSGSEKKITGMFQDLKSNLGVASDDFNISDLKGTIDKDSLDRLNKAKERLLNSMEDLTKTNATNRLLLKSRLDRIEFTLKLIEKDGHENKSVIDDFV